MQEAQRFFVLTQTDNLWKEHLQVGPGWPDCMALVQQAQGLHVRKQCKQAVVRKQWCLQTYRCWRMDQIYL